MSLATRMPRSYPPFSSLQFVSESRSRRVWTCLKLGCFRLEGYVGSTNINTLLIPVVPHEAVPEVSKNYLYINQKKNVPIEIVGDMFDHFALRATSIRATFCAELLVE